MAKKIKIALMLCLTLCLAALTIVFAACDNSTDGDAQREPGTMTFTVQYEDGSPVTDVYVQLCIYTDYDSKELGVCLRGVEVDENGTVEIANLDDNSYYQIHLENVPAGYTYKDTDTQLGVYSYTLTLVAESVA